MPAHLYPGAGRARSLVIAAPAGVPSMPKRARDQEVTGAGEVRIHDTTELACIRPVAVTRQC
jgi:hypothetical protein